MGRRETINIGVLANMAAVCTNFRPTRRLGRPFRRANGPRSGLRAAPLRLADRLPEGVQQSRRPPNPSHLHGAFRTRDQVGGILGESYDELARMAPFAFCAKAA